MNFATLDIETTPFKAGRLPVPLAAGIYDGEKYTDFFGTQCVEEMADYLRMREPLNIFCHNGGKFDFHFFAEHLYNPIKIIGDRIAQTGFCGSHTAYDSYAMIPVPLSAWKKDDFNYSLLEFDVYRYHRAEILRYLESDCKNLYEMVDEFIKSYGRRLTIGAAAFNELKARHEIEPTDERHDSIYRPFYHGGRVQCFRGTGIFDGDYRLLDVNSLYPSVMKNYNHPLGKEYFYASADIINPKTKKITRDVRGGGGKNVYFFAGVVRDRSRFGALPRVVETTPGNTRITFAPGTYYTLATSHELQAAAADVEIQKCERLFVAGYSQNFAKYVDDFTAIKIRAEKNGDTGQRTFAKLFLNSAYGKFAQNPLNFYDYFIWRPGESFDDELWECWQKLAGGAIKIYRRPSTAHIYNDVAVGASITGAARAELYKGISHAANPIYCDTDSLILSGDFRGAVHPTKIGAWKCEMSATRAAIAGKKMYALFNGEKSVKTAHKGVQLTAAQIMHIAKGGEIIATADAPKMQFGIAKRIRRRVRAT